MSERNGREPNEESRDSDASVRENAQSDCATREQWLPAAAAAAVLGVSIRTVQKQAAQGKIASRVDGRRLLVCVTAREAPESVRDDPAEIRETDANVREQQQPLVDHLQQEIAFLRAQLEQRDVAESELRRLMMADKNELQQLRQQLAIAAAPIETPESSDVGLRGASEAKDDTQTMPARYWWQFWKGRG